MDFPATCHKNLGNSDLRKKLRMKKIFLLLIIGIAPHLIACNNYSVNNYINKLPTWQVPEIKSTDLRNPKDLQGSFSEGNQKYNCRTTEKSINKSYENIIHAGINSDILYPGSLLQGKGIATKTFDSVRLERSPITLTIDLNIEAPSIEIANPTTANMRNAISELIRRADTRLGEIDVVPGKVSYEREEAHTFEQALTSIGISAGYKDAFAAINADFNFGAGRKVNSHTIVVRFFQPMFTISFDEASLRTPKDLFAEAATKKDLKIEIAYGRVGKNNLPVYVKSVTYGRMLFYTLTSEQVSNYQELEAAVSAVYGAFSGGARITDKQLFVLKNSHTRLLAFGGSQNVALEAIADLNKFFVPTEATTAVPISFVVKNLDGSVATIGDNITFYVQNCTTISTPIPDKKIIISLSDVDGKIGFFICKPAQEANCHNMLNKNSLYTEKAKDIVLNNYSQTFFVDNEVIFHIKLWNPGCWGWSLSLQIKIDGAPQKINGQKTKRSLQGGSGLYCDQITEVDWGYKINKKTGKIALLK